MEEKTGKEKESSKLKLLSNKLLYSKPQEISERKDKENSEPSLPITLSRKVRWIVFAILIYAGIVMELDQGALSSTTDSLAKDMELNDSQLGGLGSMIFLGKSFGCLVFFSLINKINRKIYAINNFISFSIKPYINHPNKKFSLIIFLSNHCGLCSMLYRCLFPSME